MGGVSGAVPLYVLLTRTNRTRLPLPHQSLLGPFTLQRATSAWFYYIVFDGRRMTYTEMCVMTEADSFVRRLTKSVIRYQSANGKHPPGTYFLTEFPE